MMATQSTTAFALGVLALAPGGAHIDTRPGRGGSSSSSSSGRGVGLVDAFVGQPTTIRAGGGRGGGSADFSARRSGLDRCVRPPCGKTNRAAFSSPLAMMTLKSGPRPTSGGGSGSSSKSGRDGVKRRVTRTTGFGNSEENFKYVAAIKGGVVGFLEAMDQSLSGELVTVVTYMPWCRSCHHLRHRLRVLAEAHALAGSGAMFYEIDLNANPEVHKMLDIHATPTVLLYCSGQLVDEFTCAGDSGPRVMLKHIEEQVGSIPDPWHRIRDDVERPRYGGRCLIKIGDPAGARAFTLRRVMPDNNWKPGGRDWNVYKKYTGNRKRREALPSDSEIVISDREPVRSTGKRSR